MSPVSKESTETISLSSSVSSFADVAPRYFEHWHDLLDACTDYARASGWRYTPMDFMRELDVGGAERAGGEAGRGSAAGDEGEQGDEKETPAERRSRRKLLAEQAAARRREGGWRSGHARSAGFRWFTLARSHIKKYEPSCGVVVVAYARRRSLQSVVFFIFFSKTQTQKRPKKIKILPLLLFCSSANKTTLTLKQSGRRG